MALYSHPRTIALRLGEAAPGARLYFYEVGSVIPKVTNHNDGRDHAHPVVADNNGIFPAINGVGQYKVILKDADDALIWTEPLYAFGGGDTVFDYVSGECLIPVICGGTEGVITVDNLLDRLPPILRTAGIWLKEEGINQSGGLLTSWDNSDLSGGVAALPGTAPAISSKNGIATVQFGAGTAIDIAGDFTLPFTMICVIKGSNDINGAGGIQRIWNLVYPSNPNLNNFIFYHDQVAVRDWYMNMGTNLPHIDAFDTNYHVHILEAKGPNNGTYTISDIGSLSADIGDNVGPYRSRRLGATPGNTGADNFTGEGAEFILIDSAITEKDNADIISYYKTKFDF